MAVDWTDVRDRLTAGIARLSPNTYTLKRIISIGTLDPESGQYVNRTEQTFSVVGLNASSKMLPLVGPVNASASDVLLTAAGEKPIIGDLLEVDNELREIVEVGSVTPGDVDLLYLIKLRG